MNFDLLLWALLLCGACAIARWAIGVRAQQFAYQQLPTSRDLSSGHADADCVSLSTLVSRSQAFRTRAPRRWRVKARSCSLTSVMLHQGSISRYGRATGLFTSSGRRCAARRIVTERRRPHSGAPKERMHQCHRMHHSLVKSVVRRHTSTKPKGD
jgi:hypothetical protein